ncbi:MAG TPA: hypothetical protein PK598_16040, partial [Thermoanaerobaculia bacterium]|nr:hypothetical protein [Thermoanaerobaculia bacterium]
AGVWLFARELEGPRAAAVALGFAAAMRWPLLVGRWMFSASWLVALMAFAAAGAVRSLRTGRLAGGLLAGVAAGVALSSYPAAAAVVPLFLAAWGLGAWRDRGSRRAFLLAAALVAGFSLLQASQLLSRGRPGGRVAETGFWTQVKDPTLGRRGGTADLLGRLAVSTRRCLGVFLWTPDPVALHGLPDAAPLTPLAGGMALTGLALLAVRARRGERTASIPLGLVAGAMACGILSNPTGAPGTLRMSVLVVPAAVAAGAATAAIVAWLAPRGVRPAVAFGLVAALLLTFETLPLFAVWPWRPDVRRAIVAAETEVGRRLGRLAPGPAVREPGALDSPP